MHPFVTQEHVDTFQREGVVLIKGLFQDYVDMIRAGIERNMVEPGVDQNLTKSHANCQIPVADRIAQNFQRRPPNRTAA